MRDESEEQRKLLVLIEEAKNRGLKLPEELTQKKIYKFHTDSRGYFVKLDGRLYNPTDQQEGFILSNSRFVGYGGSRGSGKSSAGAQKALRKIMQGESGAVMNADFENLKTSTWAEFREWIPWDMVVPAHRYRMNIEFDPHQQFRLAFLNGATVVIKGVKDPSAARGANINWLWYDEAQRDDTGLSWQIAIASVRVGKDPQAWATFTPSPQGKDFWGYKFFVQQDIAQEAIDLFEKEGGGRTLVEFFKGTIYDNQDNLDPGFMASLLALYAEGGLRQREVLGEFVGDESYLGDRRWFDNKILYALPDNLVKKVRYWDLAAIG